VAEAENKEIVRRYVEVMWNGERSLMEKLVHPDLVDHSLIPGQLQGRAGHEQMFDYVEAAFSNHRMTLLDLIAEGDKVVDYWIFEGVHSGEFMGAPASGRTISFKGIDILRLENGQIRELWHVEDLLSAMRQMGAVPEMESAAS
jgi:steroid delta-isomerase-like uncharacterized protein